MKWEPWLALVYLDNALQEGEITDEEWIEERAEWLAFIEEQEGDQA